MEIDDDSLDKAEAATNNPLPQGEDPKVHLLKSLANRNMPPLNARVQGGDYSGSSTCVDPVTAETEGKVYGEYADDDQDR